MSQQGPRYPGTVTTEAVGTENANDWLTPGNISADDGAEAQITAATYDAPDISFRLKAQNFGFTIPADSVINGIIVEIDRRSIVLNSGVDFRVQLLDAAGALVGENKASATVWPTTSTIATYGGAADKWTWTGVTLADINDVDFGVVLSVTANIANADIGVDFIRATVDYSGPPVISSATMADSGRAWPEDAGGPYQDIVVNFDVAMEKLGGVPYSVGDTIPGFTCQINAGANNALTYRGGDSTTAWTVRVAQQVKNGDTVVLDYARATGGLVADVGGTELAETTDAPVTNNLTKRIRAVLKRGDTGAVITTAVDMAVLDAEPRDADDAAWMAVLQRHPNLTPTAAGVVDVEATDASLVVGDPIYVAVFNPREDSSGASTYARTTVSIATVT